MTFVIDKKNKDLVAGALLGSGSGGGGGGDLSLKEDKANKNIAGGYAGLDENSKLALSQIGISRALEEGAGINLTPNGDKVIISSTSSSNDILTSLEPIGTIKAIPSNNVIEGHLMLDGGQYAKDDYLELWTFAVENNITTTDPLKTNLYQNLGTAFKVPNLKGYFLRGLDITGTIDPEGASRTLLSIQQDEFKSHNHRLPVDQSGTSNLHTLTDTGGNDEGYVDPSDNTGGAETRPKNIAISYYVRAKHTLATTLNQVYAKSETYSQVETNALLDKKSNIAGSFARIKINETLNLAQGGIANITLEKSSSDISVIDNTINLPFNKTFAIFTSIKATDFSLGQQAIFGYINNQDLQLDYAKIILNFNKLSDTNKTAITTIGGNTNLKLELLSSSSPNYLETRISSLGVWYVGIPASSISKDNSTLVVVYKSSNQVKIFTYLDGVATLFQTISTSCSSVAVSQNGSRIAIGSRYNDTTYIYDKINDTYSQAQILTRPGAFGQSIAISNDGNTVAVSSHNSNKCFIFKHNGTEFVETNQVSVPQEISVSLFSYSISLSGDGNTLVATNNSLNNNVGQTHIFDFDGTNYNLTATIPYKGYEVSLSDDGLRVGISGAGNIVGNVVSNNAYLYEKQNGVWTLITIITKPEEADSFGYSCSLSSDGTVFAVSTKTRTINDITNYKGAVYIYKESNAWGNPISIEPSFGTTGEVIGYTTSISSNGSFILAGGGSGAFLFVSQNSLPITNIDIVGDADCFIDIQEISYDNKVDIQVFNNALVEKANTIDVNTALDLKADKSTTYTKTEVDDLINYSTALTYSFN